MVKWSCIVLMVIFPGTLFCSTKLAFPSRIQNAQSNFPSFHFYVLHFLSFPLFPCSLNGIFLEYFNNNVLKKANRHLKLKLETEKKCNILSLVLRELSGVGLTTVKIQRRKKKLKMLKESYFFVIVLAIVE